MSNWKWKLTVCLALTSLSVLAQDFPMIMGESYSGYPLKMAVAPGQIVTLYVRGLNVPPAVSKSDPLARELSGVYVLLEDGMHGWSAKLPLMRIGTGYCSQATCADVNIVAQIPYGMPLGTSQRAPFPTLTVFKNGQPGRREEIAYAQAVPRIVSGCVAASEDDWGPRRDNCSPVITREDGSRVTYDNPFTPGETISVYAWGLGPTDPTVEAGVAVKQPARTLLDYRVRVCYSCSGLPEGGFYTAVGPWFAPEYVGLAVGSAGLYQINVKTPLPPPESTSRFAGPIGVVGIFIKSGAGEFSTGTFFRGN